MATRNQEIASIILFQMGGMARLHLMTGANSFVAIEKGVQFRFKMNTKINTMVIKLDEASDTYTVEFWQLTKRTQEKRYSQDGVYCDMLVEIFERETGLTLQVPTIRRVS